MIKQVKPPKHTPFSFLSKEKSTAMKTLVFCVSIVFIFLLLCWILFRLISPQKQRFTVNQAANFYLVNSKTIQSYQLQNDQFQLMKTEDVSFSHLEIPEGKHLLKTLYPLTFRRGTSGKLQLPSMLIRELGYQTSSSTQAKLQLRMVFSVCLTSQES